MELMKVLIFGFAAPLGRVKLASMLQCMVTTPRVLQKVSPIITGH